MPALATSRARPRRLIAAAALLLAACSADTPGTVGAPAPDYAAVTLAGDSISLADLRDTTVMLNIWATWCAPCRDEMPVLEQLHEAYAPRGLRMVGVSIDAMGTTSTIRSFADQFGITYELWHDPDDRATAAFLAPGVPMTVLIDREGVVRWRHVGPVQPDDTTLLTALDVALASGS